MRNHAKAFIHAWYPGSLGGLALAKIFSGEANPSARLPVTIYKGDHNLPDFENYSMKGRTYRYIEGDALYPFGYGLSYTKFAYENAKLISADGEKISVSTEIANIGGFDGKETVQVYASYTDSRAATPHWQLCAVKSVMLKKGEKSEVTLDIDRYWVKAVTMYGERVDPDGKITLYIGGHQPDAVSTNLLGYSCLKIEL